MSNKLVAINEFVKRQTQNSGKTYTTLSFNDLADYAEKKISAKSYINGYREGVILIDISKNLLKFFICPFVKINKKTKLKAEVAKRRSNEEHYIRIKAINGNELTPGKVQLILYRNDVLKETKENTTDATWELISFHAIPKGIEKMPMGPVTMMRNQLQLPGGTKGIYESEEWAESVYFWQNYAIKENSPGE
jgi:hypothetical protein